MKLLSLFSGIGAFEKALGEHELVNYCEIDKYASKSYSVIHGVPEDKNLGDITKVNTSTLPNDIDLITYGFPCVPAGYLIKTKNGYKPIENVTTNDYVLTHTNTYQKVVKTMNRISAHINHVKGVGCIDLQVTDEHPVYVLRNNEFMWIKAKDLLLSDRLVFNKNTKSENTDIPDNVLWLMGRYFADGYKENHALHRAIFCIGKKKTSEFEGKIQGINFVKLHENRSCVEYKLMDNEVLKYFTDLDTGSLAKDIPQWIIDLSKDKLIHFYNGYYSGDGHNRKDRKLSMFCTVSKKMAYELQDVVIKLFNVVPSLSIRKDKRSKTFNDSYCFQFSSRPKEQIIREDKICVQIKNLYREEKQLKVFNFEVENDNSYTVNNVIVHNCQDISQAGKQKGFTDENGEHTRSGLFFEALRIIQDAKPKYAIAENVKALVSKKFKTEFSIVLDCLEKAGYNNYYKVLNSKDYGIPQNRERVFIVSIRKDVDDGKFTFPQPFELKLRLKDLLEDEVDSKYYLSEKILQRLQITDNTLSKNIIGTTKPEFRTIGQRDLVFNPNGVMGTLVATVHKQPKQILESKKLFGVFDTDKSKHQAGSVWDSNGLAPTLDTMQGGYRQPCVLEDSKKGNVDTLLVDDTQGFESEPRIYKEYSPTLRSSRQGLKIIQVCNLLTMNGDYKGSWKNPDRGRVFSPSGLSPTITCMQGGGLEPKIMVKKDRVKQIGNIVTTGTCGTTGVAVWGKNKQVDTNSYINEIISKNIEIPVAIDEQNVKVRTDGLVGTLMTDGSSPKKNNRICCADLRIRKLTPKECWRLMGFDDKDIDKCIAAGLSNSQLYKQAGNSIVVNVIKEIFKSLFKNYETDLNKI